MKHRMEAVEEGYLRSPPARGRGLKLFFINTHLGVYRVAPRAGAWIETFVISLSVDIVMSPPARGRGLKLLFAQHSLKWKGVAPRAGAWIETPMYPAVVMSSNVAPRAGAWIETS